ncbi:Sugar transporter [Forsythia ovata]|uniref:Sugar transporter n=1 Tax=Forsythia ovata TaxID=205694 RepID=A0ABD1WYT9_9LAMI
MGDRDQSLGYTLDEALSTVGFGTFQGLALLFSGAGWVAEAMEMMLLSFIGPSVKSEWTLSSTEESLLTTAVFGGMLVGAYFWGFIIGCLWEKVGISSSIFPSHKKQVRGNNGGIVDLYKIVSFVVINVFEWVA